MNAFDSLLSLFFFPVPHHSIPIGSSISSRTQKRQISPSTSAGLQSIPSFKPSSFSILLLALSLLFNYIFFCLFQWFALYLHLAWLLLVHHPTVHKSPAEGNLHISIFCSPLPLISFFPIMSKPSPPFLSSDPSTLFFFSPSESLFWPRLHLFSLHLFLTFRLLKCPTHTC